jgi:hypothetical protein
VVVFTISIKAAGSELELVETDTIEVLPGITWSKLAFTAPPDSFPTVLNSISCGSPTSCTAAGTTSLTRGHLSFVASGRWLPSHRLVATLGRFYERQLVATSRRL